MACDVTEEGYQINGSVTGSMALLLPAVMCGVSKSWTADRCTAVLVRDALTASLYAPDSGTDVGDHEIFMDDRRKILTECRLHGASQFFIFVDLKRRMVVDDVTEKDAFSVWTACVDKFFFLKKTSESLLEEGNKGGYY